MAQYESGKRTPKDELTNSKDDYDKWRYSYPQYDTSQNWSKVPSQALSDYLVDAFKKDK